MAYNGLTRQGYYGPGACPKSLCTTSTLRFSVLFVRQTNDAG
ncbi:hypothetical protein PT300_02930 [Enterobacteriaceae bacterium ESL0689]|nr:hypothetical protein [Enterobacteriaceae bacterium ESL0689]